MTVDDWQYEPGDTHDDGGFLSKLGAQSAQSSASANSVGLAAGGAKDIATFRNNIEEGYLPRPQSLSYEGLFYNYYFETGQESDCSSLFCPSYGPAVTADPLSGETERYLTVGLNSGLDASSFDRNPLNLVVVLDVSGSMNSQFSEYYYDRFGNAQTPAGDTDTAKIDVARQALVALTEQLRPDDRLGIVLYSSESAVAKPMRSVGETDIDAIRGANYYSVHSTDEFRQRLDDGFKYMVSPLVFDLSLELNADGYDITQVYGSSAAEKSTAELLKVNTLFALPTDDGRTRGGVVLAQVERQSDDASLELRASWADRAGSQQEITTTISFPAQSPEYFDNAGVRKAVLLSRYADLLKNWMIRERDEAVAPSTDGIAVAPETAERIRKFRAHYEREADAIGDETLDREIEMLDRILAATPEETEMVIGNPPAE